MNLTETQLWQKLARGYCSLLLSSSSRFLKKVKTADRTSVGNAGLIAPSVTALATADLLTSANWTFVVLMPRTHLPIFSVNKLFYLRKSSLL